VLGITSPRGQTMLAYLPGLYATSTVVADLLQAQGAEWDAARDALIQILDQAFVDTATWGLDDWEAEYLLPPSPGMSDADRRARLRAALRGYGTATISVVERVAGSYSFGAVQVIEDQPAYTVTVKFVSAYGVPPDLASLKDAVRRVVPANLVIAYAFQYQTWNQFDAGGRTWNQVDALALNWDQFDGHTW
jgi:hypothetical protein